MTAALIRPDGHLVPLSGAFQTDLPSIAALTHAVHAASQELTSRTGGDGTDSIIIKGMRQSLTLLPNVQGILLIEHPSDQSAEALQPLIAQLLGTPAAIASPPAPAVPALSLADALYATAP